MFVKYSQGFSCCPAASGTTGRAVRGADPGADAQGHRVPGGPVRPQFWGGLVDWIRESMVAGGTIPPKDLDLIHLTDDPDEAVKHPGQGRAHDHRRALTGAPSGSATPGPADRRAPSPKGTPTARPPSSQPPGRRRRVAQPLDRRDHVQHLRVSATSCTRYTRAPSQADTAVVARVPSRRSLTGWSRVSPTKSLLDRDTSTGQPVPVISGSRRVASSECRVFLPKSCPGRSGSASRGPRARPPARPGRRCARGCPPSRPDTRSGAAGSAA